MGGGDAAFAALGDGASNFISAISAASAAAAVAGLIGAAMIVDPATVLARAVGVLNPPTVEAIGVDPLVTALVALGAGAPASVFFGGTGLKEARIFSAAATSCARMCGICSNTVSAGKRSFMMCGI